mmetsp:Transcript_17394/g.48012  ORF Transcript_17394/g.48012 Transcript_17394/m.48012 type:complete len:343 (+) Transcript_17394:1497-2525(+)
MRVLVSSVVEQGATHHANRSTPRSPGKDHRHNGPCGRGSAHGHTCHDKIDSPIHEKGEERKLHIFGFSEEIVERGSLTLIHKRRHLVDKALWTSRNFPTQPLALVHQCRLLRVGQRAAGPQRGQQHRHGAAEESDERHLDESFLFHPRPGHVRAALRAQELTVDENEHGSPQTAEHAEKQEDHDLLDPQRWVSNSGERRGNYADDERVEVAARVLKVGEVPGGLGIGPGKVPRREARDGRGKQRHTGGLLGPQGTKSFKGEHNTCKGTAERCSHAGRHASRDENKLERIFGGQQVLVTILSIFAVESRLVLLRCPEVDDVGRNERRNVDHVTRRGDPAGNKE